MFVTTAQVRRWHVFNGGQLMVEEVHSADTTNIHDRRRPGRIEYGNQHLVAILRRPVGGDDSAGTTNIDGLVEENDDAVNHPTWSDRTILSVLTGLTVLAVIMWTTIALALWRAFFG
jgi:hypothetical protein